MKGLGILSFFCHFEKAQKGYITDTSLSVKYSRKRSEGECINSGYKGCEISFKLGMSKGYHLSMEGTRKGYLNRQKWSIKE